MLLRAPRRKLQLPSYYEDQVERFAQRKITPLTLHQLLKWRSTDTQQMQSVVQQELPVRLARIVRDIQSLPFIVGMNPHIRHVHSLYLHSFERLRAYSGTPQQFPVHLREMVDSHSDVVQTLAAGMSECRPFMKQALVNEFLDRTINSRIGIRVLAEHYLSLQEPGGGGVVNPVSSPRRLLAERIIPYAQQLCDFNYGFHPDVTISGRIEFPYIDAHLEYVLMELCKNSFRATVEFSRQRLGYVGHAPHPIDILLADGDGMATIRIRDRGGGIPKDQLSQVWQYSYSTVQQADAEQDVMFSATKLAVEQGTGGPMAGLGYGLPSARIYSQWAGGSLHLQSVQDYGTDTFIRLPHITPDIGTNF